MKATMILCDAAQVSEGKLSVLGGGWTVTGPEPAPSAVALILELDGSYAGRTIPWELSLRNQDGLEVNFSDPSNSENVMRMTFTGTLTVERNTEAPVDAAISAPLAMNFSPLPLPTGESFVWRLSVEGVTKPGWELPFAVRSQGPRGVIPSQDFSPTSIPGLD